MLGEDARKIDWKSMAKTGEPHVKLFFEEKEVNVVLCALMSGSLLFRKKREIMFEVCSLLGYEALKMQNRLTPIMIDETMKFYPTSKKLHSIEHFIKDLGRVDLYKKSLNFKEIKLKHKSFIILIGDFLGDFDFSYLSSRHELFVVIIRDSFEENPQALGEGEFTDPESGEIAEFFFGKSARDAYKKRYIENDDKLYKHLNTLGITYLKVLSDKDVYDQLL